MRIIIQAGGKGTRLERLTRNRPKCLVPVNNLPIILHTFQKFKDAEFYVIADYKSDVLQRYLDAFASGHSYKVIATENDGTVAGIRDCIEELSPNDPFAIVWSDLILSGNLELPEHPDRNYIGISKDFECRWSFVNDRFVKEPSKENGVAGLFVFKNKGFLKDIPKDGALVRWLSTKSIEFDRLDMYGSREVGTLLSYNDINDKPRCRQFNRVELSDHVVTKRWITQQGMQLSFNEVEWYKKVAELGYEFIPRIFEYEPLKMQRIEGLHVFEYNSLIKREKSAILLKIINILNILHNLDDGVSADFNDVRDEFVNKTFQRLSKIRNLVPFTDREMVKINNKEYRNVFFFKDQFEKALDPLMPSKFRLIHGDCTFSNIFLENHGMRPVLIDPRGYFGNSRLYGDVDYDWAKLYYSLKGDYDQFNNKNFTLDIEPDGVYLDIESNNWSDMEEVFFANIPNADKYKIKALHAVIWLSLAAYTWEDYDMICGAFYNGLIHLSEVL